MRSLLAGERQQSNNLLGTEAFEQLDCFLGGSDVSKLKPDPEIYLTAAKKLNVDASKCVVIEDSIVGLKAALGAEMDCVITYTKSTANEAFEGAKLIVGSSQPDESEARLPPPPAISHRLPQSPESHVPSTQALALILAMNPSLNPRTSLSPNPSPNPNRKLSPSPSPSPITRRRYLPTARSRARSRWPSAG